MKKIDGVALLITPKHLLDFIWFYEKKGKDRNWMAVCIPDTNGVYIEEACVRSGIFSEVIKTDYFAELSQFGKCQYLVELVMAHFLGKKKKMAQKIIYDYCHIDNVEVVTMPDDRGLLMGAFILLAEDIEVNIFEDSPAVIEKKEERIDREDINPKGVLYYLLAKWGYGNFLFKYKMSNLTSCVKYASYPDRVNIDNYKSIMKLNDMTVINYDEYKGLVEKTFYVEEKIKNDSKSAILFTMPWNDFFNEKETHVIVRKIMLYLEEKYERIYIKPHPRDLVQYKEFDNENLLSRFITLDARKPAEVYSKLVKGMRVYFAFPSGAIFSFLNENVKIIRLEILNDLYINQFAKALESLQDEESEFVTFELDDVL